MLRRKRAGSADDYDADDFETGLDEEGYGDSSAEAEDGADGEYGEGEDGEYESEYDDGRTGDHEEGEYESGYGDEEAGTLDTVESEAEPAEEFRPPSFPQALKQVFGRSSTSGAASTGTRTVRQRAQPATGTEEDRRAVTYIDRREQVIGYFFGAVQGGLGILNYFAYRAYKDKSSLSKTLSVHHAAPWILGIGLVFGLFTIAATISKRRAALGFVILLGGLELLQSGGGIFGLVYFGVGIWLIFKALRRNPRSVAAREARETRAAARETGRDVSRSGTSRTSSRSTVSPRSTSRATASRKGAPAPATKRYTPPKPHRPVPTKESAEPEPSNRVMSWLKR